MGSGSGLSKVCFQFQGCWVTMMDGGFGGVCGDLGGGIAVVVGWG